MSSENCPGDLCDWVWGEVCMMEALLVATELEKKEVAQTFCRKGEDVMELSPTCLGTACSVEPPACPSGSKAVGDIHTHPPDGSANFSPFDYNWSFRTGHDIHCVASPTEATQRTSEGDFALKKYIIRCESINHDAPKAREKKAELDALLSEALHAAKGIRDKVALGEEYPNELYRTYRKTLNEFGELGHSTGLLKDCRVPEFMGVWERPVERKRVK